MASAFVELEPVDFDPFGAGEVARVVPMSAAQREIWLACAMDPEGSVAYNLSLTVRIVGKPNVEALDRAVRDLVQRHDALRMTFSSDGRSATVGAPGEVTVRFVDISSALSVEVAYKQIVETEGAGRYDLLAGPLFRATVVRVSEDEIRLILGAHHIVCDGWSLSVLLRELGPLYARHALGTGAPLEPAPSFAEFAASDPPAAATTDLEHFVSLLRELPEPLELPTDRPRRPGRSIASSVATHVLDAATYTALKKRAAAEGVTPFVALFTAWTVVLGRVGRQSDLVVGLPVGLQSRIGKPGLVGHATHLLPVRARLDGGSSLGDTMRRLRGVVLDVCDHPFTTVGDLLPRLSLRRDPSRHPLLSVLFNLDAQFASATPVIDGCRVTFFPNPRIAETFELFLNGYQDEAGQLVLDCQYASELWDEQTIASWLRGIQAVVEAFIQSPEVACAKAPIVPSDERARMLERSSGPEPVFEAATVLQRIEEVARARPAHVALKDASRTLTYEQLMQHVRRTAQALRGCGVGPGDLVGLCVERNVWMAALALGAWGAGAAYIPIDPEYPQDRIAQMTHNTKVVIVDDATEEVIRSLGKPHVRAAELLESTEEGQLSARGTDLAYVLFTSGSTGRPKGVAVTHDNLVSFVSSMLERPGVRPEDVVAAVVTLSFDIAGFELYVPLAAGATIVVADEETTRDGRDLAALMTATGITVLQATPSTYRLLRAAGYSPAGLRALVGGEVLPPDLARWLLEGGAEVTNCYGPTETTIWSAIHAVTSAGGPIPIGRPIAHTQIYVVDAEGQLLPDGCYGEIVIGGRGVARGYLDAPDLTRERFGTNPFRMGSNERVYRTGDVGRWRHDDVLEIAGRNDDQIKLRGHRIELGEIETALAAIAGVREAAAAVLRPAEGEPRLAAFLVVDPGRSVTATDVRRQLRRHLPESMIPSVVVEVQAIPRTLNGKIDRRELSRVAAPAHNGSERAVPPATPMESVVAGVFQQLLRAKEVGATDNFFDLGGDSIACVEAAVAIERLTNVRVSPREILLGTVADVARAIDTRN
jgi:amino acid adenylation domain-containing protein